MNNAYKSFIKKKKRDYYRGVADNIEIALKGKDTKHFWKIIAGIAFGGHASAPRCEVLEKDWIDYMEELGKGSHVDDAINLCPMNITNYANAVYDTQ